MTLASASHRTVKPYSCRCRNITINAYDVTPSAEPKDNYEQAFVGEDGVQIVHPYLTLRTRDLIKKSPDKLVQQLNLHCLECKTKAYRIVQEVPAGSEAREGPVTPNDGWVEQGIMASRSGWIEVLLGPSGCLAGNAAIETYFRDLNISDTFSIAVQRPPESPIPSTSLSSAFSRPRPTSDDEEQPDQISTSLDIPHLSKLPPLFPPPPFTPSQPVFQLLSTHAATKSIEWRGEVEETVRNFLKLQLDDLTRREESLRAEVDVIWKKYREGWKEVVSRTSETRPEGRMHGDVPSHGSRRTSIPVSIRDFSPSVPSGTLDSIQSSSSNDVTLSSPNTSSLINRSRSLFGSFNSKNVSNSYASAHDEASPPVDYTQLSSPGDRGELLMSAFKRNMDTNVDIATSLRWAEGEEALRKRFETKDEDHRARKRTSKNLSITGNMKANPDPAVEPPATEQLGTAATGVVKDHKETAKREKQKRHVTFDIKPSEPREVKPAQDTVPFTEGLFDLDDFSPVNMSSSFKYEPVSRNPAYKMRQNLNKEEDQETQATSLPLFNNAFKPFSPLHPGRLPVNGARRRPNTINLSDALPLLSSSVPANDRIISARAFSPLSRKTQLPTLSEHPSNESGNKVEDREPVVNHEDIASNHSERTIPLDTAGEAELRNLFAASAPSHRHAWKEGGTAWKIFHRLHSPTSDNLIEDDGEDPWSEAVSDNDDDFKHPAQLARSLPIEIQPLFQSQHQLEPKTSLADKQGILVPPLKLDNHKTSSAMRRAVYAGRDLSRFVDPGPTLGLDDNEEVAEENTEAYGANDENRGRKHALSILQTGSAVPEAGMWRSLVA